MEKWRCKYCLIFINRNRKPNHKNTTRHKNKARWYKYFTLLDKHMDIVKEEYERGVCSVDELNEMENQIYAEIDKLDNDGYFKNLADSDDEW